MALKIQQPETIKRYREFTGNHPLPYTALALAVEPYIVPNATERQRWDALWASGFDVNALYKAGLDDNHIDSALRDISKNTCPATSLGIA